MKILNPLNLLDSILVDWASERVRRLVHGSITFAVTLVALWLAVEVDWKAAVGAAAAALYAEANRVNTGSPVEELGECSLDEPNASEDLDADSPYYEG